MYILRDRRGAGLASLLRSTCMRLLYRVNSGSPQAKYECMCSEKRVAGLLEGSTSGTRMWLA